MDPTADAGAPPLPAAPDVAAGDYARVLHTGWRTFLDTLPPGIRILDVALAGRLPSVLAAEIAGQRGTGWTIDAVDLDTGFRAAPAADPRIALHAAGDDGRLPFDDGAFGAACGHHVLEFVDADAVLAEVHRVLAPAGEAQFALHHAQSPLVEAARLSLREADLVFSTTKAFRRAHRLVTMSRIEPGATERATDELREAIRTLKRAQPVARHHGGGRVLQVALDAIQKLLAMRRELAPDAAGLAVDRAEAELRTSVGRLKLLADRALDATAAQALEARAVALGFARVECVPQPLPDGQPAAWQLLLHRP